MHMKRQLKPINLSNNLIHNVNQQNMIQIKNRRKTTKYNLTDMRRSILMTIMFTLCRSINQTGKQQTPACNITDTSPSISYPQKKCVLHLYSYSERK